MRISSKGHGAPIDEGKPVDATTGNGITEQRHTAPVCENAEQHEPPRSKKAVSYVPNAPQQGGQEP